MRCFEDQFKDLRPSNTVKIVKHGEWYKELMKEEAFIKRFNLEHNNKKNNKKKKRRKKR